MSSTHLLPIEWLSAVAVFPLPRVVFFPGTLLPLHIFEPRYRAMMRACLESNRPVMAVTLLKPGYEADYEGTPAMHDICTVGKIDRHEELADGRFNVVLKGISRAKLTELPLDGRPFRRAAIELLDGRRNNDRVPRDALTTLMSTASLVGAIVRKSHPNFGLGVQPDDPPHHVVDTLADRLIADPDERQDLLETLDVLERLKKLTSYVATLLGTLESEHSKGPVQ